MDVQQLSNGQERSFLLVLAPGEEVLEELVKFASDHDLRSGRFTGLGALSDVVLGFFDLKQKDYKRNKLSEQVEIVSLVGNFSRVGEEPRVHPHIVVARSDGMAFGGHLLSGHVCPTLEISVVETPALLERKVDPMTGLALIRAYG
jgi:predicted DNA-binding protein with PD1-like motif